ncbi:MAG: hypothetical protein IKJ77_06400 [Firmicutes bacterium]|nr:hypothetical protein [Bacillota bacterium]
MQVTSKVVINQQKINELLEAAETALGLTAELLHTEVQQAQVVPRDTGNLQNEAFFVDTSQCNAGVATLVHAAPYARRLYFHPEYNFQTHKNPNAKGEWFEDWLPGGSKENFCSDAFAESYRRNAGL